jgi:DNA-binding Lrp family transcriptional regulator
MKNKKTHMYVPEKAYEIFKYFFHQGNLITSLEKVAARYCEMFHVSRTDYDNIRKFMVKLLQYRIMIPEKKSKNLSVGMINNVDFWKQAPSELEKYKIWIYNPESSTDDLENIWKGLRSNLKYTFSNIQMRYKKPESTTRYAISRLIATGFLKRHGKYYKKCNSGMPVLEETIPFIRCKGDAGYVPPKTKPKPKVRQVEKFINKTLDTIEPETINEWCALWYQEAIKIAKPKAWRGGELVPLWGNEIIKYLKKDAYSDKFLASVIGRILLRISRETYENLDYILIKKPNTNGAYYIGKLDKKTKLKPLDKKKLKSLPVNSKEKVTCCGKHKHHHQKPKTEADMTGKNQIKPLSTKACAYYEKLYKVIPLGDTTKLETTSPYFKLISVLLPIPEDYKAYGKMTLISLEFNDTEFTDPKWIGDNKEAYILKFSKSSTDFYALIFSENPIPALQ